MLGIGDGEEIMVTVNTSEVTEEKLLFSEFLLWTRIDPWFRCSICIQLKSYNHSKRGGVSTPSHKEETEIQRSFSSLAEFHSCRMVKEDLTPGLLVSRPITFPLVPEAPLEHAVVTVGFWEPGCAPVSV